MMVGTSLGMWLNDYGTRPQLGCPVRACVMAAARVIPGVWAVFVSRSRACTIFTPYCFQSNAYPRNGLMNAVSQQRVSDASELPVLLHSHFCLVAFLVLNSRRQLSAFHPLTRTFPALPRHNTLVPSVVLRLCVLASVGIDKANYPSYRCNIELHHKE